MAPFWAMGDEGTVNFKIKQVLLVAKGACHSSKITAKDNWKTVKGDT